MGFYKKKTEKNIPKYICTNYSQNTCVHRYAIEESFLVELIEKRMGKSLTEDEIREVVDYIEVHSKRTAKDKEGKNVKLYKLNIHFTNDQLPIIIRDDYLQL